MSLRILITSYVVACAICCRGESHARDIGLVLSGGGAKGAYEVGVWTALCESGLDKRVCCISGTSVGSINAVLFASVSNPSLCERFWLEVVPYFCKPDEKYGLGTALGIKDGEDIAAIKARLLEEKAKRFGLKVSDLSAEDDEEALSKAVQEWKRKASVRSLEAAAESIKSFGSTNDVLRGFADGQNFRRLLYERIPDKWGLDCVGVYATAVEKGIWEKRVFRLDNQPKERVLDVLIASCGIPYLFDSQKIDGKLYVDGGLRDNVPINPILENYSEVKTVIVVYLDAKPDARRRVRSAAENNGVCLLEIIPSDDIGGLTGVFDNRPETARRLIGLGREDARMELVKAGLVGK